jgi:hypothetical protein
MIWAKGVPRTIPRAMIATLVVSGLLYIAVGAVGIATIGPFAVQSRGTASVAAFFSPITLIWFVAIAADLRHQYRPHPMCATTCRQVCLSVVEDADVRAPRHVFEETNSRMSEIRPSCSSEFHDERGFRRCLPW